MGIAWHSPYQLVNIYLIWNQTVGKPIVNQRQVATGWPGNVTYDWTGSCAMPPNCGTDICASSSGEAPFVLRIVDADGDLHEVNDGGFWSRELWIQPLRPSSTSAETSTTGTTSTTTISFFYLHDKSKLVDNYLFTAELFVRVYGIVRYKHHILPLPED
ncbi:hypothetical protein KC316_g421 [Hortaea werneckii]|nr:hypothetical protein KC324_g488 [Hortaea werneckii]KAI7595612.1 hypothetical protein KC316_g421 [Hortaea werneckii]